MQYVARWGHILDQHHTMSREAEGCSMQHYGDTYWINTTLGRGKLKIAVCSTIGTHSRSTSHWSKIALWGHKMDQYHTGLRIAQWGHKLDQGHTGWRQVEVGRQQHFEHKMSPHNTTWKYPLTYGYTQGKFKLLLFNATQDLRIICSRFQLEDVRV